MEEKEKNKAGSEEAENPKPKKQAKKTSKKKDNIEAEAEEAELPVEETADFEAVKEIYYELKAKNPDQELTIGNVAAAVKAKKIKCPMKKLKEIMTIILSFDEEMENEDEENLEEETQ